MKKMYKNLLLINAICFTIILNCLSSQKAHAQLTTIYSQNFDSITENSLPTGWTRTSTDTSLGWYVDTTNSSTGYTGATGSHQISVENIEGNGTYKVTTQALSTMGYDSISVIWGERRTTHFPDSGSVISFAWGLDTNTWNNVTYIENPNNSTWYLINDSTRIPIPSGAWNQAAVYFRWTAVIHNPGSGTLRIDDYNVKGKAVSGINEVVGKANTPSIFLSNNNQLSIQMNGFSNEKVNFNLYSINGKQIMSSVIQPISQNLDLATLSPGIYLVSMIGDKGTFASKIFIRK
jgi:hypothetical protein